jgi:fluoride ion exporter CrcB/FEX
MGGGIYVSTLCSELGGHLRGQVGVWQWRNRIARPILLAITTISTFRVELQWLLNQQLEMQEPSKVLLSHNFALLLSSKMAASMQEYAGWKPHPLICKTVYTTCAAYGP